MPNTQAYSAIRPMFESNRWRIFPGDQVMLWKSEAHLERVVGTVLQVIRDRKAPQLVVEGWNLRKKKVMTGDKPDEFFVVTMEAPIPYASVGVVDPATKRPVRIKFRYSESGERTRVGRGQGSSGLDVPIPIPVQEDESTSGGLAGDKDTPEAEVKRVTYEPTAPFPFSTRRAPQPTGLLAAVVGDRRTFGTLVGQRGVSSWAGFAASGLEFAVPFSGR